MVEWSLAGRLTAGQRVEEWLLGGRLTAGRPESGAVVARWQVDNRLASEWRSGRKVAG